MSIMVKYKPATKLRNVRKREENKLVEMNKWWKNKGKTTKNGS